MTVEISPFAKPFLVRLATCGFSPKIGFKVQQRMPLITHEIKTNTAPYAQNKQGINKTNTLKDKQQNDADNHP